jgi:hypothetical protein
MLLLRYKCPAQIPVINNLFLFCHSPHPPSRPGSSGSSSSSSSPAAPSYSLSSCTWTSSSGEVKRDSLAGTRSSSPCWSPQQHCPLLRPLVPGPHAQGEALQRQSRTRTSGSSCTWTSSSGDGLKRQSRNRTSG